MSPFALTDEQLAVVHHDPSRHATVLAVAGAGKTTAMTHRVVHLTQACDVPPARIRALMFNRDARLAFQTQLRALDMHQVEVRTFHSMAHKLVEHLTRMGRMPARPLLTGAANESDPLMLALRTARERSAIPRDESLDVEELQNAIAEWKAMLVPPSEVQTSAPAELRAVYEIYEELRDGPRGWRTFDDLLYDVVHTLEADDTLRTSLANRVEHFILDEYQDVNWAQHRLVELLAGDRARIMVVGDDDQCIYEWRGARSSFIRKTFERRFDNAPHDQYRLTRTFRFGPALASIAAHVIARNNERAPKALRPGIPDAPGRVEVHEGGTEGPLVDRLLASGVPHDRMVALVRTWNQAAPLQFELLHRQIPFYLDGGSPFYRSLPIRVLHAYLALADGLRQPMNPAIVADLMTVANRPLRYVSTPRLRLLAEDCGPVRLDRFLRSSELLKESGIHWRAAAQLGEVCDLLERCARSPRIADRIATLLHTLAPELEKWLDDNPGDGLWAEWNTSLAGLHRLVAEADISSAEFEHWLTSLDTRRGEPDERCLRITTIFRAKGLEWDHVLLPNLSNDIFPDLRASTTLGTKPWQAPPHDDEAPSRAEPVEVPATSPEEAERRLFYVALTRARLAVHLFPPEAHGSEPSAYFGEIDQARRDHPEPPF